METLQFILQTVGYGMIVLLLLIVFAKVVWNIGLPYAMMREQRQGRGRGWSLFPAIEILPLLIAVGISFLISAEGFFSPRQLAIWGFVSILFSYVHLVIIALLDGLLTRRR